MNTAVDTHANVPESPRLKLADWLWRPWYAKLWWATIPIWWSGMAASTKIASLEAFYDSAFAGFLNVLFFPMTALMVLGVGYVQHWLAQYPRPGDGVPLSDHAAMVAELEDEHERAMRNLRATTDIHDPRSGGLYIGNPLSLQHPSRFFRR